MGKPSETVTDRSGIQVIARAAAILRALDGESQGMSLGELATRLGLARSTVQRIVKALLDEQLLMAASSKSRVKLGPLLMHLGASAEPDITQIVAPIMEKLSTSLGETVDLSIISGDAALFIDQVVGTQRLATVSRAGTEFPLHSTANGKSLLASLPPQRARAIVRKSLSADTVNTITDIDALMRELDEVRRSKIAFDREEHTLGVSAVGTWFEDGEGQAYAISIPVPSLRFSDGRGLVDALLKARSQILRHPLLR